MVFRALFDKIKQGLAKTRGVFTGIASLFRLRGRVDKDFLAELEKRLYLADVGTAATAGDRRAASARPFSTRKSPATWRRSSSSSCKELLTAEGTGSALRRRAARRS